MADDVQQEMVECFDGSKTIAGCEKLDGTGSMGGLATPEKSAGQVNMEAESVLVPDGTSMDVPEQVMRVEGSSSDVVEPLTPATDKSPSESGRVTPASQSDQSAYLSSSEKSTTSHKSKITDPPTRQIEFDAASTSSGSVKNEGSKKVPQRQGLQCRKGEKIEAMDYLHQWFPAKIRAVNEGDAKVLVHYDGWNQRYDEWITMNSDRIRPLIRHSKRKEKSKRVKTDHMIGDQVYAKWTDCKMYPAKITNILPSGSYEVIFYDGFKKLVQPINVRSMPGGSK
ncbi:P20L1-like protein, partial [Mya arenaria]